MVLAALILAFAVGAALWWMYFNFAASAIEYALRTHRIPALVVRDVLGYGHLALVIGLIMTAVGLAEALSEPTTTLHGLAAVLLPAGTALFTLIAVNLWEHWIVSTGRPVPLLSRAGS